MNFFLRLSVSSLTFLVVASQADAQQSAAPYTFASRYNVSGQLTGTISPDPDGSGTLGFAATRNTFGTSGATAGLLIKTETGQLSAWANDSVTPELWTGFTIYQRRTFEYDTQGRKLAERVIGKNLTTTESLVQFSYDEWDRVICKVVRMNPVVFASPNPDACQLGAQGTYGPDRITRFSYDTYDQVLTEQRALSTSLAQTYVTNTYAGRGVLTSQTDSKGNRTELRYDSNWRMVKRVYPSPTTPGSVNESDYNQYGYDQNGNVTFERKRNSQTIGNTFDANNRLTFKNLSDNTYSGDISYGYDLRGLTRYSCFGTGATNSCDTSGQGETNSFDGLGNLSSRTSRMSGTSRTLTYQFDSEGNRTRVTHPDGVYFTYARDALNRMCTIGESSAPLACSTTDPNAFVAVHYSAEGRRLDLTRAGGTITSLTTDNALRLGSFTQNFSGTTNDLTNGFVFNPASQIVSLTQSNTQYNYTDAQNRVGNYGVNGLNQYTQIDGSSLTHDASGNLILDGAGASYSYDMENHLVATAGAVSSTLTYDVLGRLSQLAVGGTTTQFLYDSDALAAEYTAGAVTRRYVHGDQIDEPLVQYNGAAIGTASRRYLFADHQGSIISHSDNSGAVLAKNAYDPYGIPASTNADRFGYTGQTWLKELGLDYYKARVYSPKLGRFLQTDAIFYADDFNLYAYVGNDPLDRTDPSGSYALVDDVVAFAGGGLVGVAFLEARGGTPTWAERAGAFVSGGVVGLGILYAPATAGVSTMVATSAVIGGVSAGLGNLTKQAINIQNGEQSALDKTSLALDTAVGAVVGAAAPAVPAVRIPGLSAGRGNADAVAQGVRTRIANGNAANMSTTTAVKGSMGSQTREAARTAVNSAAEVAKDKVCKRESESSPC